MPIKLLVRLSLITAISCLSSACKTTDPSSEPVAATEPREVKPLGADTSAPFPPETAPSDAELDFTRHKVAKGETFYAIARQYGSNVKDIIAANPGVEPTALRIGQEILVPVKK